MLDLNAIKTSLEAKLNKLEERATEIEDALSAPKNPDSEERAVELEDEQTATAIGEITGSEIRDIKFALRRIATGEYSTCESCGKHIPTERLRALPWTSRCTACS
jgi:RNA polymerase-binding transcription factor DksA